MYHLHTENSLVQLNKSLRGQEYRENSATHPPTPSSSHLPPSSSSYLPPHPLLPFFCILLQPLPSSSLLPSLSFFSIPLSLILSSYLLPSSYSLPFPLPTTSFSIPFLSTSLPFVQTSYILKKNILLSGAGFRNIERPKI